MRLLFDRHIGVDYSGRDRPTTPTSAIQVYQSCSDGEVKGIAAPTSIDGKRKSNWSRSAVASWLISQLQGSERLFIGIDHGFSFPLTYFQRYRLSSWRFFLEDFCTHWPTDLEDATVKALRTIDGPAKFRVGDSSEFRLAERWTSSAKSVFQFDMQGSVATSTHAGLPWLRRIRDAVPERIHFWPFDGWHPPVGKSVIAEIYPSLVRNRYPRDGRTVDQQDAYSVARWLSESDRRHILQQYFSPPLTDAERAIADLEGWIFGVL